ncbi:MAG TPA: ATP synthase F0 subunit B [Thermotoga sp.]|nr:ATP synthase F0 subunit B [Thermotoga sp.]
MGFLEFNWTSVIMLMTFGLLVYFLNKFLYKPFLEIMDRRKEKIEGEIKNAENLRKEAEELRKKAEEELKEASRRAQNIVERAEKEAEAIINEAREKAKIEAQRIVESGRKQVEMEMIKAMEDLRKRAGELAVTLAMKILSGILDEKAKREYLMRMLKREIEKK